MDKKDLLDIWIDKCRNSWDLSERTIQSRTATIDLYFNKYKGELTLDSFEGFLAWMKKRGNTVQTRVSRGGILKLFIRFCAKNGACNDFTDEIRLPKIYSEIPQVVPSEDAERAIILATEIKGNENKKIKKNKGIARIALRFALRTGLRKSELLDLKPSDLRIEQGIFYVRTTKSYKTVAQPLTYDMVEDLKKLMDNEYLFQISSFCLNGYLHRGSKRAGLSIRLHLHSLRDCYASDQLSRRVSMQTVKDNMRHKDYSSLGKYSGAQMDDRIAAANSSAIVEGGLTQTQKIDTLVAIIKNCGIKLKKLETKNGKVEVVV